jgi:hypothetical protein
MESAETVQFCEIIEVKIVRYLIIHNIWGPHSGGYEEFCVVAYNAV